MTEKKFINEIFLVQHSYEYNIDETLVLEETKTIGTYSSLEKAKQAVDEHITKPGFNKHPKDCFCIDKYELNKNHWEEGFATWNNDLDDWE